MRAAEALFLLVAIGLCASERAAAGQSTEAKATRQEQEPSESEPPYWSAFQTSLTRIQTDLADGVPADEAAGLDLAVWVYGYATEVHPGYCAARLDLEAVLATVREHCRGYGRETTDLSSSDVVYIHRCISAMDLQAALTRLDGLSLQSDPQLDMALPQLQRERAVVARLSERWSESEGWLDLARTGLVEAQRLSSDRKGDEREKLDHLFLMTRLDIAAAALLLNLERGTPEMAGAHLQDYADRQAWGELGTDKDRALWAANGAWLEMRYRHALGDQAGVLRVLESAEEDPDMEPLRSAKPEPQEWTRLRTRAALARSRMAEARGQPTDLAAARADLEAIAAEIEPGSIEWVWVQIRKAAVENDLGFPDRAQDTLRNLDHGLAQGPVFKELVQAQAAQRARAILGQGADPDAEAASLDELQSAWETLLADWSMEDRTPAGAGVLWFQEQRDMVESLLRMLLRVHGPEHGARRVLNELMRLQSQGSLARRLEVPAVSADQALDALVTETRGLLIYFPGHLFLHVVRVDSSGVRHHSVPLREGVIRDRMHGLQAAVEGVRSVPSSDRERRLDVSRQQVSEAILPAELLSEMAHWTEVLVVGLETVGYVPFEYLLDEDNRAIGVGRAVSYSPSVGIAHYLNSHQPERVRAGDLRIVSVACPSPAGDGALPARPLPSLPYGESERRLLQNALPREGLTWLEGPNVTLEALRATVPEEAHVLQLLAHGGRADASGVTAGRIIHLDQGDRLDRALIESLALPPVVAFDVCGAGAGLLRPGDDGRDRLWGAALISGAVAVSLPVLDVDYHVTLQLRSLVQEAMFERGLSLQEAWREARQAMLASPVAGAHEVEYFLHHVYGAGWSAVAERRTTSPRPKWILGGVLVVFLGLVALVRRITKIRAQL